MSRPSEVQQLREQVKRLEIQMCLCDVGPSPSKCERCQKIDRLLTKADELEEA